ncbi:DegQ family serine endoprotease [Azohydromonas lata]|uniref:Probable periplasmic serine endoprotease DegP-like n=1 Tax=Azohydromonas lata TaxID=45677 RepID=A0ABU5ILN0_9BURK|nr:DegQ family serine endoprotease [Azohydromonas lata]MDZ5459789.1 DegQ family serine endoprotease [Azohydromonas lata]
MSTVSLSPARLTLSLLAAGVIGGAGATFISSHHAGAAIPANTASTAAVAAAPIAPVAGAPDFSQIAERHGAAVVNITVTGMRSASNDEDEDQAAAPQGAMPPGMSPNDPFYEFFRRFGPPGFAAPNPRAQQQPMRGQGSGFIVSADGVILTNAHVVHGAKEVTVKLTDRREFQAKVLGEDPKTDVAVIRINAKDLPVVPLGSTRELRPGEWVAAMGSPFGFENSVTVGVVSAKGRSLPDDGYVPFIQTDVAINPGNSGGPLFNARGEVVGINSQIYSRSGGYMGLSFAIPIELATKVKEQIVATGKASHARLGVAIQEVNQSLADSFKLDRPEGALVASVDPGGPADKAGLQVGDVIRKVDGQAIVSSGDLPAVIGQSRPGEKVALEVWRHGKREEISAKLGDAAEKPAKVAEAEQAAPGQQAKLGLALRPLQPQELRGSGVTNGLVVEQSSGPSARAGVQPGDVLVAINGTPVKSVEQVREAVAKSDKSVALLIQRGDSRIFVPVRIG